MMYKELSNVLGPHTFQFVKDSISRDHIPWYYTDSIAREDINDNIYHGSFYHMVMDEGNPVSHLSDICVMTLCTALDCLNIKFNKIIRIRIGCITGTDKSISHPPHVDTEIKHNVGLFYLNTCNGNTFLYDKRYVGNRLHDYADAQIVETSQSVENKFITFSGNIVHSSSTPTDIKRRLVINYNFV